ncbi:MAG: PQQ-binding-like beta-propeller repeat protein [Deltaproteobacteria bacterium]|nr:PQQ-binding-like beta-propeller repeat protein [Deltaproteobacteria bacterium]
MRWDGSEGRSILVFALQGRVGGMDRSTGEVRWLREFGDGGEVFLVVTDEVVLASSDAPELWCLDYTTGKALWQSPTTGRGRATIVLDRDQVVVAKGGYVNCFDRTGKHLWSNLLKGYGTGRIALGFPGNVAQADDQGSQ